MSSTFTLEDGTEMTEYPVSVAVSYLDTTFTYEYLTYSEDDAERVAKTFMASDEDSKEVIKDIGGKPIGWLQSVTCSRRGT